MFATLVLPVLPTEGVLPVNAEPNFVRPPVNAVAIPPIAPEIMPPRPVRAARGNRPVNILINVVLPRVGTILEEKQVLDLNKSQKVNYEIKTSKATIVR